ncbi:hypothetical protein TNCV_1721171 [Trichonephila clavipes]|nr:hypothetical protein TNCV_1721171 [Trichonephila clavipes]
MVIANAISEDCTEREWCARDGGDDSEMKQFPLGDGTIVPIARVTRPGGEKFDKNGSRWEKGGFSFMFISLLQWRKLCMRRRKSNSSILHRSNTQTIPSLPHPPFSPCKWATRDRKGEPGQVGKRQKKPAESLKQAKSPTTNKADDKCCFKKKLPSEDIRPTTSSLQQMGRKPRRGGDIRKICRRYPENVYLPLATAVENKTGK